jgi:hypothetical protein
MVCQVSKRDSDLVFIGGRQGAGAQGPRTMSHVRLSLCTRLWIVHPQRSCRVFVLFFAFFARVFSPLARLMALAPRS